MRYVQKSKTWKDNWNDIVRYVIFPDETMKKLMCLPSGTNIVKFSDKYFIELSAGAELLTNESVRILYYDSQGSSSGNMNVLNRTKQFDVYVKEEHLHDVDGDKLKERYCCIEERLKYLILNYCQNYGLRFRFENSYNLWTKTQGYRRYHIVFSYKTTV